MLSEKDSMFSAYPFPFFIIAYTRENVFILKHLELMLKFPRIQTSMFTGDTNYSQWSCILIT